MRTKESLLNSISEGGDYADRATVEIWIDIRDTLVEIARLLKDSLISE